MIIEATETLGAGISNLTDYENRLFQKVYLIANFDKVKQIKPDAQLSDHLTPMYISGPPGISKTERTYSVVNRINKMIDKEEDKWAVVKIQLGQTMQGEFSGIPMAINERIETYVTPKLPVPDAYAMIKDETGKLVPNPKYHKYGILFLDELSSANTELVQPALGLADGTRTINDYKLPDHWLVVGAGNGPDSANFIKLDDMTLSRFEVFDILDIDYKRDSRKYFSDVLKMDPLILAYLDTHPEKIMEIQSNLEHIAGKQMPVSRTWRNLNAVLSEIRLYKVMSGQAPTLESVSFTGEDFSKIAARCVGDTTAEEFESYIKINAESKINSEDILTGKAKGKTNMKIEVINYLMETCIKTLKNDYESNGCKWDNKTLPRLANYTTFFIETKNPEHICVALLRMISDLPDCNDLVGNPNSDLAKAVPDLGTWFDSMVDTLTDADLEEFEAIVNGAV